MGVSSQYILVRFNKNCLYFIQTLHKITLNKFKGEDKMKKRKIKVILGIALSVVIMLSAPPVYAASVEGNIVSNNHQGYRPIHNAKILERFNLTEEDLINAEKTNKSFFEITKAKGFDDKEVRNIIIEEKYKIIDEKVKSGKLTKEEGDNIKVKVKESIEKWDGKLNPEKKWKRVRKLEE